MSDRRGRLWRARRRMGGGTLRVNTTLRGQDGVRVSPVVWHHVWLDGWTLVGQVWVPVHGPVTDGWAVCCGEDGQEIVRRQLPTVVFRGDRADITWNIAIVPSE